jgi:hypothetical protein
MAQHPSKVSDLPEPLAEKWLIPVIIQSQILCPYLYQEDEMNLPEYISKQEVQRVCTQLNISDWTQLTSAKINPQEAAIIRQQIGGEALDISIEDFQAGLEVELEHGITFPDANVTNNHPLLTGKIVLAHLKESLDYYARLEVAELEGDIFKALVSGNAQKMADKYQKLVEARAALASLEQRQAKKSG